MALSAGVPGLLPPPNPRLLPPPPLQRSHWPHPSASQWSRPGGPGFSGITSLVTSGGKTGGGLWHKIYGQKYGTNVPPSVGSWRSPIDMTFYDLFNAAYPWNDWEVDEIVVILFCHRFCGDFGDVLWPCRSGKPEGMHEEVVRIFH